MHRSRTHAPLLALWLPLACDDQEAVRARQAREQQLDERIARVEALASELAGRVKVLEDQRLRAPDTTPATPAAIVAELTPDGVRVDGETVDLARLEALLRERVGKQPDLALTVKAGREVEYARVIAVLDLAKNAGVVKVALADEKSPP